MSSERWSRALMAVGEGLGDMASYQAQLERDQANHMRDMSLQRLRGKQAQERDDLRHTRDVAMAELEQERRVAAADLLNERNIALEGVRTERRKNEMEAANKYQTERWNKQRLEELEARTTAEVNSIDQQIYDLDTMLSEASLELGGVNEEGKAQLIQQRALLEAARLRKKMEGLIMLRELGHDLYKDKDEYELMKEAGFSDQEISEIKQRREGGQPEPGARKRSDEELRQLQAQLMASGKMIDLTTEEGVAMAQRQSEDLNKEASRDLMAGEAAPSRPGRSLMDLETIKDEQGNPKYPMNRDALGVRLVEWLKSPTPYGG